MPNAKCRILNDQRRRPQPPLQFPLRALLGITAAVSLLFGVLRWLGVSARAGLVVLAVLVVGALAALGLLIAIAGSVPGEDNEAQERNPPHEGSE